MTSMGIERRRAGGGSCEGCRGRRFLGPGRLRGAAPPLRHDQLLRLDLLRRRQPGLLAAPLDLRLVAQLGQPRLLLLAAGRADGRSSSGAAAERRAGFVAASAVVVPRSSRSWIAASTWVFSGERAVVLVDEERADALEEAERVCDLAVAVARRPEGELSRAVDLHGGDGRAVVAGDVHEPLRVDHRLQLVVELLRPVEVLLLRLERAPGRRLVQPSVVVAEARELRGQHLVHAREGADDVEQVVHAVPEVEQGELLEGVLLAGERPAAIENEPRFGVPSWISRPPRPFPSGRSSRSRCPGSG